METLGRFVCWTRKNSRTYRNRSLYDNVARPKNEKDIENSIVR
jgi:hypothetical protein